MSINIYKSNSGAVKRGADLDLSQPLAKRPHREEESSSSSTTTTRVALESLPPSKEKRIKEERNYPPQVSPTPPSSHTAVVKAATNAVQPALALAPPIRPYFTSCKDLAAHCSQLHTLPSFEARMQAFLRQCPMQEIQKTNTYSFRVCLVPGAGAANNIEAIINIYTEDKPELAFDTGLVPTSLYLFEVYEFVGIDEEFKLGYNENEFCLFLRATRDGKYGEITYLNRGNKLSGTHLSQIFLALESLFTGEWSVKDGAALEEKTSSGEDCRFVMRFSVLADLRGTWYQRLFGFQEIATLPYQNKATYDTALKTLRSYTVSQVWSFMKDYEHAGCLKEICAKFFGEDSLTTCTRTLQELHKALLAKIFQPHSLREQEEAKLLQADLLDLLFVSPESYDPKDPSNSPNEKAYWEILDTIVSTQIFIKRFS